jgi:glucan phosphoethanolaminetransferase (alkaline phosphatase superfamily)
LFLYVSGSTPSDEWELARAMAWPAASFKHIFLAAEVLLLVLIFLSLFKYKFGIGCSILIFVVPLSAFVVCASFGVFVVDRFVFPQQHKIEFGLVAPILARFGTAIGP